MSLGVYRQYLYFLVATPSGVSHSPTRKGNAVYSSSFSSFTSSVSGSDISSLLGETGGVALTLDVPLGVSRNGEYRDVVRVGTE